MRIEGNGFSKLAQVIRKGSVTGGDSIELATVTSPPPNLKIKVDGMSIELEKDDLVVAERLSKHSRNVSLLSDSLTIEMSVQGYTPHTHKVEEINVSKGEITFLDELKNGDRVIVAGINNGQSYVIVDKVVVY